MHTGKLDLMARVSAVDLSLCLFFNRAVHRRRVQRFFSAISRLGNGVFWYAIMGLLPVLHGLRGLFVSTQMATVGIGGVLIYRLIKTGVLRERPFVTHTIIQLGAKPLDRHSFPSGHTLHAVGFTSIAVTYYPELAVVLVPFAILVALSRMILGLHYPSDVITGALLGAFLAWLSFAVIDHQNLDGEIFLRASWLQNTPA